MTELDELLDYLGDVAVAREHFQEAQFGGPPAWSVAYLQLDDLFACVLAEVREGLGLEATCPWGQPVSVLSQGEPTLAEGGRF